MRISSASLPLPVRRRRVVGGAVWPAGRACPFGAPRSTDRWRFGFPRADGGATPSLAHRGALVPPPRRCRRAVSSSGGLGGVRWCVGGLLVAVVCCCDWRTRSLPSSPAGEEAFGKRFSGCCRLGAGPADDGGSCGCSPSTVLTEDDEAQLQGVRGLSPADVLQRLSSRRLRARRVPLEVLQPMVLARSCCGWLCVASALLFPCLLPVRVGKCRRVGVVLLFFVLI